jgi:BNR repeat-like domain
MSSFYRTSFLVFLMSALSLGVGIAQSAKTVNYQFEPEPRPVLQQHGIETSRHPHVYLKASNLYLLAVSGAHHGSRLTLSVSNDGGDSFDPPVAISEPNAQVSSHGENSPTLAINGIEFYALWEQNNEHGGTDLVFSRSLRFGRKFEKPIRITDKEKPSQNGFSFLAVAPDGKIYAVWLDGRNPTGTAPGTSCVYLARSRDHGATFERNILVANNACPCCRPTLAFGNRGEVFVAWRGVAEGDIRDTMLAVSNDHGASFSAPARVAVDNWKISGCPHSGPSMVTRNKRLYISWHSEGEGTNAGIRIAWSEDSGKTFSRPVIASGSVVDTNHPMLSLSEDGRLVLVFKGRDPVKRDSWGPISAYLCEIDETGAVSSPIIVPGNSKSISYPAVAASTVGRVYVVWTEGTEKGQNVMLTRARRTNLELKTGAETRTYGTKPQPAHRDHNNH